jgi:5-methylcytosine-specific restriction endonuclease McrA
MFGRALVLNATYEPICVVSSRRALLLVLCEKAETLHSTAFEFRSARVSFPEPSVIRLSHYVRVPRQTRVAITKRSVFARDGHRCQYCGAQAENIDHVIPRSRGGPHAWENVVAACRRCNTAKEDRLLEDSGFTLRHPPRAPRSGISLLAASGGLREEWGPYVSPVLEHAVGL